MHALHEFGEIDNFGLERLPAPEGKQSRDKGLGPLSRLHRTVNQSRGALIGAHFTGEELERGHDWRQQIVEVMRNAAGQLTERFKLAHFVQLRDSDFPLGSSLLDAFLKLLVEDAQLSLRGVPLRQQGLRRALPSTRSQCGSHRADQGCRMKRSFESGYIAEMPNMIDVGDANSASSREQNDWQVRPRRLVLNASDQRSQR